MERNTSRAVENGEAPGLRGLDPRIVGVWRAAAGGLVLVAGLAGGVAAYAVRGAGAAALAVLVLLALGGGLVAWWPVVRFRRWGFAVRERDVIIRRGVVWRSVSIVPHARIQHVDTRRGPLERWAGLARVILYTAGSTGGALTIPGLDAREAEGLRDRLAELGGIDDAV